MAYYTVDELLDDPTPPHAGPVYHVEDLLTEQQSPESVSSSLKRPAITLSNGQQATVRSIGVGDDSGEWVIPTIVNGKLVSNDEAINLWRSGSNSPLGGPFKSIDEANNFAQRLHEAEAKRIRQVDENELVAPQFEQPPVKMGGEMVNLPPAAPGEKSIYEEETFMDKPILKLGDYLIKEEGTAGSKTEEGINEALRPAINSLTTPRNLMYMAGSLGLASTGTVGKALVSSLWTGLMGKNAVEQAPRIASELGEQMALPEDERDTQKVSKLLTEAGIDTFMAAAPAVHLAREAAKILPRTTQEVMSKSITPGEPNAIQKQSPNEEMLRQPQPEMELQGVGKGNTEPEITAGTQEEVPVQAQPSRILLTPEQQAIQARLQKETAPFAGMGGATPSEFEASTPFETSVKNEVVAGERMSKGLRPAVEQARRSFGNVWDEASKIASDDPQKVDDLVAELKESPRAIGDTEDALLLQKQIATQNAYERSAALVNEHIKNGAPELAEQERLALAKLSDDLLELYDINKSVGRETARGLNARKMMADEQFNLAKMITAKRAMKGGKELTPAEESEVNSQHEKIIKARSEVEAAEAKPKQSQVEVDHAVKETVKRVKKEKSTPAPEDLDAQRTKIVSDIKESLTSAERDFPEMGSFIQKLMENFVRRGITERDALTNAVHDVVKDIIPDWSRRNTMDAMSGYGKFTPLSKDPIKVTIRDIKGQLQQVAKLEDLLARKALQKTGPERKTLSNEERRLTKLVNEYKKRYGVTVTDPSRQLKSSLDAVKTRLTHEIADLEHQLATRTKIVKSKTQLEYDAEANALKAKRDALKEQFNKMFGKPEVTEAQRLKSLKTRMENEISKLQDKLERGDFSKKVRKPLTLDKEAQDLRAKYERAKQDFQLALLKDQLKHRTWYQKGASLIGWARREGVLSSPISVVKLISAAAEGIMFEPMKEAVGYGLAKTLPEFAKRLETERASSVRIEAKVLAETFMKTLKDSAQTLRHGKSDLDTIFGGRHAVPQEMVSYFGRLHAMLKTPLKRSVFTRVMAKISEQYIRKGVDVTEPAVQMEMGVKAMKEANRALFLEDNRLVTGWQALIASIEKRNKPSIVGTTAATAMRVAVPIVRIPTNLVARTLQAAVGFPVGATKLAIAYAKGIKELPMEQADLIARQIKAGSIGGAILLLGYFNPKLFGGYYQPGEKRPSKDVKAGEMRTPLGDVPTWLLHHPLIQVGQLGATVRRVTDSKLNKKAGTKPQGLPAGVAAGLLGLVEEVPIGREIFDLGRLHDPHERQNFINEYAKSLAIPQGVQWAARQGDKNAQGNVIPRRGRTLPEHLKTGIPGLRKEVPVTPAYRREHHE